MFDHKKNVDIPTPESNFSNFVIEHPGEIESEFKNTLPSLSGT